MKKIVLLILLLNFSLNKSYAASAITISEYIGEITIVISEYIGDETWIVKTCPGAIGTSVVISDYIGDLNVVVSDYIGDRTVCVTNPNDLDEETLRKLKLID